MSNEENCIMGGISITWKVEIISSTPRLWITSFPLDWATTKSKWMIELMFLQLLPPTVNKRDKKGITLFLEKLDDMAPITLFGTVFAVNGNTCFQLSSIHEYDFRNARKLHRVLKYADFKKEGLIHEDCLTFVINLWDPNINDLVAAEYFIRSTCIQQTCSFQWSLKDSNDWKREGKYYKSSTEVPMEFIYFHDLLTFRIFISLFVSDDYIFPVIEAKDFNRTNFFIRGTYKLEIRRKEFNLQLLEEEWGQTRFHTFKGKETRNMDGIRSFIDSECVVKLNMLFVTNSKGIIERICYETNPTKLRRKPEIAKRKLILEDSLQNCIQNLYEEGRFCDVMLRANTETFPCHKAVLCARSSVFQMMFENDMTEKETSVVNIDDVESQILRQFLNYLYSDNLSEVDLDSLMKLYEVADKYAVFSLQEKCADTILSDLSTDNVCEVLDLADSHQDDVLKKKTLAYFYDHSKEIVNSSSWKTLLISKPLLAAETLQAVVSVMR